MMSSTWIPNSPLVQHLHHKVLPAHRLVLENNLISWFPDAVYNNIEAGYPPLFHVTSAPQFSPRLEIYVGIIWNYPFKISLLHDNSLYYFLIIIFFTTVTSVLKLDNRDSNKKMLKLSHDTQLNAKVHLRGTLHVPNI